MDFYKTPTWQVIIKFEKMLGFWPFGQRIKNAVICSLLFITLHSFTVPLAVRLFHEWTQNVSIVVENLVTIMVILGTSFKILAAYFFQERKKKIYSRIMKHLKKLQEEESKIMTDYIDFGLKFILAYIGTAGLAITVFEGPVYLAMIFNIFSTNSTNLMQLPYYLEYGIDQNKYYNYILAHIMVIESSGSIVLFTYDLSFVLSVQHNCALLNIARQRLKKALEFAAKYGNARDASSYDECEANRLLIMAIDIHSEALQLVVSIDDTFSLCWFLKLLETVVSTGALLSVVIGVTTNTSHFVSYLSYLIFMLVQFNVPFNRGQKLIDHSCDIFEACYDCEWDKFSKKTVSLLGIVMLRSSKISYLTGGKIFLLSNESYGNMLKTAFSYCALFNSYVKQDDRRQ